MKKTLLIMTAGGTDVQLVVGGKRHKLDGNCCGRLHDEIKSRDWSLVDAPKDRSRDFITTLPPEALELCTPKLDAILARFGGEPLSSVLIFETTRQDAREPRLAGEVIEKRLHSRGVTNVARVAFLTGEEPLEDPKDQLDAIVRRSVVAALSRATAEQLAGMQRGDRVFVATTGGLAAANEVIIELVRLHAVGRPEVTALEVPDGNRGQQEERAIEERFHPASGYRARWHALSLIEKGNLLGAWGAVSHLTNEPGQEWTQVIHWLAHWASSLPLPSACGIPLLTYAGKGKRAVRSALQVELALRAGNIPSAVHGTVAFFESALVDHLDQRREAVHDTNATNEIRGYRFAQPPASTLIGRNRRDKSCPFYTVEWQGETLYNSREYETGSAKKLVHEFLQQPELIKLEQVISQHRLRDLRNDVAHNVPTEAVMVAATDKMQKASLWSTSPPPQFLCQPLVQNVLTELAITDPAKLCEQLISKVEQRILNPS